MTEAIGPGMKVECINATPKPDSGGWTPPTLGAIYTVAEVGKFHPYYPDGIEVRLVEIKNRARGGVWDGYDVGYDIDRFRPIRDDQHSIEVFRKIDADVFSKETVGEQIWAAFFAPMRATVKGAAE